VAHAGLLLLSGVALVSAAAYEHIAGAIRARPTQEPNARRAGRLFSWWWDGLAALNAITTLGFAAAAFDHANAPLSASLTMLFTLAACFAFASLVYYLLYVATGAPRPLQLIFGYYLVVFIATLYLVSWMHPEGAALTTWSLAPTFANVPPRWAPLLLAIALVGPPVVATTRYVLLYSIVDQRTIRYRIALTAVAISAWIALFLMAPLSVQGQASAVQLVTRGIALLAAALTLLAYEPPSFIKRRYRVRALRDERAGATQ